MLKGLTLRFWFFTAALAGWCSIAGAEQMIPAPSLPFISVQTSDPLASEPGNNPGSFTISRAGNTNAALTVGIVLGGTATNEIDYTAIPTNITLAAGQVSTNIIVTPVNEPNATGYKTVVLTLPREKVKGGVTPPFLVGSLNRSLVYIVYNYTNLPPSVNLVSPTSGASFLSKPNIFLAATASDSNGWVAAVQFFANGQSLGVVSNFPFGASPLQPLVMHESHGSVLPALPGARASRYLFVWTNVSPGEYVLTAAATDNAGLQTTSAAVDITVTTNLPIPQVRIINPASRADFPDQAPVNLYAAAGETNGVIDTVEFFANGNSLGTATNYLAAEPMIPAAAPSRLQWLPFYFRWTNAPVGSNILTVVASDNNGTKATSAPVNINVTTNRYHGWRPY